MPEREPNNSLNQFRERFKPLGRRVVFPISSVVLAVAAACSSGYANGERNPGDVNCDGNANAIDAQLLFQKNAPLIYFT